MAMNQMTEQKQIEQIIRRTFRVPVSWRVWKRAETLPLNLRNGYEFQRVRFSGRESLLMIDRSQGKRSPTRVEHDLKNVQRRFGNEVVYVSSHMTHYQRQRLISQGIPFILPGRQLFLPDRAINLQERNSSPIEEPGTFMPMTQVALLHLLYNSYDDNEATPAELAHSLGCSRMSMTRALNQLEGAEIILTRAVGRHRRIEMPFPRRTMWEKALPYLRSPALRSRWIVPEEKEVAFGLEGGLPALAEYSNLASPQQQTLVIYEQGWQKEIEPFEVSEHAQDDPEWLEVQIWSYDPSPFARGGVVDPLSLYLSLRGTRDERVEEALEEMIREFPW